MKRARLKEHDGNLGDSLIEDIYNKTYSPGTAMEAEKAIAILRAEIGTERAKEPSLANGLRAAARYDHRTRSWIITDFAVEMIESVSARNALKSVLASVADKEKRA